MKVKLKDLFAVAVIAVGALSVVVEPAHAKIFETIFDSGHPGEDNIVVVTPPG